MENTGYWIFFCNPKMWAIDDFLKEGIEKSMYKITKSHRDYFEKGQLGIVRVGKDTRTKKELNGKEKLKRGIYAIVEINSKPEYKTDNNDPFWIDEAQRGKEELRVDIRYLKNHLTNPILLDDLREMEEFADEVALIKGRQTTTWSISEKAFDKILEISDLNLNKISPPDKITTKTEGGRKVVISNRYERRVSTRNQAIKIHGLKCKVCDFDFEELYGEWGEGFIEVHHIQALADNKGEEIETNPETDLTVLCANCHRMIHRKGGITLTISELKEKIKNGNNNKGA